MSSSGTHSSFNSSLGSFHIPGGHSGFVEQPNSLLERSTLRPNKIRPKAPWRGKSKAHAETKISTKKISSASEPESLEKGPKTYTCPCCQKGAERSGDLNTHLEKFCYSRNVWINRKRGHRARGKALIEDHCKSCSECKAEDFEKTTTGYDRTVISCTGCEVLHADFEKFKKHLKKCGQNLGPITTQQRSRQIRVLLLESPLLRAQLRVACANRGTTVDSIEQFEWNYDAERAAKVVEQLEYGARDTQGAVPNLGIPTVGLSVFLDTLIIDALLNSSMANGTLSDADIMADVYNVEPESNLPWPSRLPEPPTPSFMASQTYEAPFFNEQRRCESPTPSLSPSISRHTRTILETSPQHPKSAIQVGLEPFERSYIPDDDIYTGFEQVWNPLNAQTNLPTTPYASSQQHVNFETAGWPNFDAATPGWMKRL